MNSLFFFILYYFVSINSISILASRSARIVNATYSTGISFSQRNYTTSTACLCSCQAQPHCLSLSVTSYSSAIFYCQLFATYPYKSSQLTESSTSYVLVLSDRVSNSVYVNNGSRLSKLTNIFAENINPWIPIFKIFTGNNQTFLWLNSSDPTTQVDIPMITINRTRAHWFSVLISQWKTNAYRPNQIALGFIVNNTIIFDFVIFNGTQATIFDWHTSTHFASSQYWDLSSYMNASMDPEQMKAIYSDSTCTRSFNTNYKSPNQCDVDFYGYYFMYGGEYTDSCIAAVRNITTVAKPTIFYSPLTTYTSGNLDYYRIADGIMGFVR